MEQEEGEQGEVHRQGRQQVPRLQGSFVVFGGAERREIISSCICIWNVNVDIWNGNVDVRNRDVAFT